MLRKVDFIPNPAEAIALLREFLGKFKGRVTKICVFQRSDSSLYSRKKIKFTFLNLAIPIAKIFMHTKSRTKCTIKVGFMVREQNAP